MEIFLSIRNFVSEINASNVYQICVSPDDDHLESVYSPKKGKKSKRSIFSRYIDKNVKLLQKQL